MNPSNIDRKTVSSFGNEWSRFDQSKLSKEELSKIFKDYFKIFPWDKLPKNSEGFDMGCGSGRWAYLVSPKVGRLNCIDPSSAIDVARLKLSKFDNVFFYKNSVGDKFLPLGSQDFGYSLGVLHHVPDTEKAIESCVDLLKPGAPFLLYLYYKFDNKPFLYRAIWNISNVVRRAVYHLPFSIRNIVTDFIAIVVYYPLAEISCILEKAGFNISNMPLAYYRNHSFHTMRTDSRDRFGTPLEKRFTKLQIKKMMQQSGLKEIHFSDNAPFWCVVGIKK